MLFRTACPSKEVLVEARLEVNSGVLVVPDRRVVLRSRDANRGRLSAISVGGCLGQDIRCVNLRLLCVEILVRSLVHEVLLLLHSHLLL